MKKAPVPCMILGLDDPAIFLSLGVVRLCSIVAAIVLLNPLQLQERHVIVED
jgi:hypothetical protein